MDGIRYQLKLDDREKRYMNLKINSDSTFNQKNINPLEYETLQKLKNRIFSSNDWDKHKKFSNDYELIHIPNKRNRTDSVALYQPLSRSYFKMIEIIHDFNLISNSDVNFQSAHLAEGPGGFLEATYNMTFKKSFSTKKHFGITLYSTNKDVPGWNKAYEFLTKRNNVHISYGADNTGDLYQAKNILHFAKVVGRGSCNLITGDGGFDFSTDFNKQEQMSYKLILCEIISSLYVQKIGGCFVCKFFDIYTLETAKLLFLLCSFYEEVYIHKPLTSRPANSEKYIICKGFLGIDYSYLDTILQMLSVGNLKDIFDFNLPDSFIDQIREYNKENTKFQIKTIEYTLNLIQQKKNLSFLNNIIGEQVKKAKEWCEKYHVKINYRSNFVSKYL